VGNSSSEHSLLTAWLRRRLTEGERPREEWRALWEASWDHLLATPVDRLVDANTLQAAAEALLDADLVTELSRPVVSKVARVVIAELREDEQPIDRFLPAEAHEKLHAALARPGLVHPDWVRAVFRGEAAEAVLNDALYRALKDFSTLLPRLMVKVSPVGRFGMLGNAGAFAEKLIEELEKRIEPEIRSFLLEGSERLLERAAEFTISKLDEPASIEFRSKFVDFVLSKSPGFLLEVADDELIDDMGEIVELSARHVTEMPELKADLPGWIARALAYTSGKTLAEALGLERFELRPPMQALADAAWPAFTTLILSPQAQDWMDQLLGELLDEYENGQTLR
jgi:hypothetical protein